MSRVVQCVGLFAACVASGAVAGLLGGPPHAIWPPIGIALAGLLVGGLGLWPAVAAAAFALAAQGGNLELAAGLGAAYTAQAVLGAWLVRRFVSQPLTLNRLRDAGRFLLIAGPLSVLPTTVAVAFAAPGAGVSWWWGDAVGGMVFAPLALTLVGWPRAAWSHRRVRVGLPVLAVAALAVGGAWLARSWDAAQADAQLVAEAERARSTLHGELNRIIGGLTATRRTPQLAEKSQSATDRAVVQGYLKTLRRSSGLVQSADVFSIESGSLRLLVSDPSDGPRTPAIDDPIRAAAWNRAVETNASVATAPDLRSGTVIYLPFFDASDERARGVVAVTLDWSRLQAVLGADRDARLRFALVDEPSATPVEAAGQRWDLAVIAPPSYLAEHRGHWAERVAAVGFGFAALLAAVLLPLTRRETASVRDPARVATLRNDGAVPDGAMTWLAQNDSRLSGSRFMDAQQIARLGYWEFDTQRKTAHLSAEAAELLGFPAEPRDLTWDAFVETAHPHDHPSLNRMAELAATGNQPAGMEFRVSEPGKGFRWVAITFRSRGTFTPGGVLQGVLQDVTIRKESELALRASQGRLAEAQRIARLGHWDYFPQTEEHLWSAEIFQFLGLNPDVARPGFDSSKRAIHPDDWPTVEAAVQYALTNGDRLQCEFRVVSNGVTVRHLYAEGRVKRDAAGRAIRLSGVTQDVTERKEAENALRASEERFRWAFDSSGVGMALISLDGRFLRVNPTLCRTLGYSAQELLGRDVAAITHPDDRESCQALYRRTLESNRPSQELEKRYRHKDGHTVWALATIALVRAASGEPQYFIGQVQDITERKRTETELRASEALLAESQRIARLGSWQYDSVAEHLDASLELRRILGSPPGTRLTLNDLRGSVPPDQCPLGASLPQSMHDTLRPIEFETRVVRPDGEERHLLVRARIGSGPDGNPRLSGTAQDISDRKKAEAERQRFETQLRDTQRLESLGVLAGGIAHDFNNLLTGVLGNASLLKELLPAASPLHEYLRPIEKSAEQAAHLCQQMLAYAGKGQTVRGWVDLKQLAEESSDLLRISVPRKAELRWALSGSVPAIVADAGQLRQVLLNLVHNAAESLNGNGGTVTVAMGTGSRIGSDLVGAVWSGEKPTGRHVWLEVADTGCGMDKATLARIFEPFFTTKFTGRGLGLSAVHGIIRNHGGALAVTSTPGVGTRFRIYLPAEESPPEPSVERTPLPATKDVTTPAPGLTALLADDEPMVRGLARTALRAQGFTVVEAENGQQAVDHLRADPQRFAVVLLDVLMPVLDGREALKEIRAMGLDIPVVLMSGYTAADIDSPIHDPDVHFLQKPFRPADLTACVRRLLARGTKVLSKAELVGVV